MSGRLSFPLEQYRRPDPAWPSPQNRLVELALGSVWVGFGGGAQIHGTVTITGGTPVSRRVRLYDRSSGQLLAETWSDAGDGSYAFDGLDPAKEYVVIALDDTRTYNLAGADGVIPQ